MVQERKIIPETLATGLTFDVLDVIISVFDDSVAISPKYAKKKTPKGYQYIFGVARRRCCTRRSNAYRTRPPLMSICIEHRISYVRRQTALASS